MGKILKIQNKGDEKVEVTLELSQKEVVWLQGNMDKMHLFSEGNLNLTSRLVQRGKRESTKYFLLPKEFRNGVMTSNTVPCTRIETKTKYLYIFSASKY